MHCNLLNTSPWSSYLLLFLQLSCHCTIMICMCMVSQSFKSCAEHKYIYDTPHQELKCRIIHYLVVWYWSPTIWTWDLGSQLLVRFSFKIIDLLMQGFYCLSIDKLLVTTHTITMSIFYPSVIFSIEFKKWILISTTSSSLRTRDETWISWIPHYLW